MTAVTIPCMPWSDSAWESGVTASLRTLTASREPGLGHLLRIDLEVRESHLETGLSCQVICVIIEIPVSFWLYGVAGIHRVPVFW